MKFYEKLNEYIEKLSCTAKELCDLSGISPATLSRYRSGERLPEIGTEVFDSLCHAVAEVSHKKGIADLNENVIREAFLSCEDLILTDKELLRQNFNTLVGALNINIKRLCKYTNYDASTIFRIRNGSRNPANCEQFAHAIAAFVSRELDTPPEISALARLMGCEISEIEELSARNDRLCKWLLESPAANHKDNRVAEFLDKLDEFDLNEYIKAIHFDQLKVPSMPFQIPTSRSYFGLQEMMESELDFLKATVLSKSMKPVTMYSDMPMTEMAKDPDFPKKWMFGMALMLKKGLHLNQIHNLGRSFEEMMLGLESWIPLYMTGQISPYYLKNNTDNVFLHFLKVSGAAALSGEAITGYHSDGKYYLTKSPKEIKYYTKRAEELLKNAHPLMDIYRIERESEWNSFLIADAAIPGKRRSILSTLPLYTISDDLLTRILKRNQIQSDRQAAIRQCLAAQRERILTILQTEPIEDEIPQMTPEELSDNPPILQLSSVFLEMDISYTQEEYYAHLAETGAFARENPNYTLKQTSSHTFRNLQIFIHEGQWAMISKGKAPAIHFVIRHPKLRGAIEGFIPLVREE